VNVKTKVAGSLVGAIGSVTRRLTEYAEHGSEQPSPKSQAGDRAGDRAGGRAGGKVRSAVRGAARRVGLGTPGGDETRVTNVVEHLDIGAPIDLVYNQWTTFEDFPGFMKKVEHVEQESDEKLTWKVQILWSHRTWQSEIVEQVPGERIVWRSQGDKGHVDGAVTFHALGPSLTRVILVLEYHPQGFFEHVGNLWRAQGRRARLELKHFGRHVTTRAMLHPDEVQGWRGEIREGQVVGDGTSEAEGPGDDGTTEDEKPGDDATAEDERPGDDATAEDERPDDGERDEEGARPEPSAEQPVP
jgi:uncharacterized membrane protein